MALSFDRKEIGLLLRILKKDPLSILGFSTTLFFGGIAVLVAIFGNRIVPYDPESVNLSNTFSPPSFAHLMGTDNLGRDIFSRVIVATPIDLEIAVAIIGVSITIGLVLGSVSGYYGGRVDDALMRLTDLFLAFPSLVLALSIAVALGPGLEHTIEALSVSYWPIYARLARAGALSLKENQFIEAARAAGLSGFSIIRRHILSNNISQLLVYGTLDLGTVIIYASTLSYLGLGVQPPTPEWGRMVYEGQTYLVNAWWVPLMPGIIILVIALGFNLLGDALRDALDPRYRK